MVTGAQGLHNILLGTKAHLGKLFKTFRTRLIANVVTGKLDVRHLAPAPDSVDAEEMVALDMDEGFDDELLDEDGAELVGEVANADD